MVRWDFKSWKTSLAIRSCALATLLIALGACVTDPEPTKLIEGRVLSSSGVAVSGARVRVIHFPLFGDPPSVEMASGLTDASGSFSLQIGKPPDYRSPNCAALQVAAAHDGLVTRQSLDSYGGDCGWEPITGLILSLPPGSEEMIVWPGLR